ncbi:MAG: copper-binding protein [Betaproteobacteria bacterium]|nr:copper-binding protein [Betaproteobacteria bacterium]
MDLEAKKVTLRHGPIPNLEMPDMTMVFQVLDEKMLDGLKPGDKVRFKAEGRWRVHGHRRRARPVRVSV